MEAHERSSNNEYGDGELPVPSVDPAASFTLRPAGQAEHEFVYRVREAAFREYVEQVFGWDDDQQRRQHEVRLTENDFQIITHAGHDVGVISVTLESDCMRVNHLYLLPAHQGRGIGRKCIVRVIEEASRIRIPVRLKAMHVNRRAIAFYERLDFAIAGHTDTHVLMQLAPRSG